ncbi:MAG: hypothetical protein ACRDJC_11180 [Thermomicrobiales bacterium]
MRVRAHGGCHRPAAIRASILMLALVLALTTGALAQEADSGFSPAIGPAQVIAQGVVALPEGESVWRTVRTRAPLAGDARFEARPLGFVLASTGPMLLVDQATGRQTRLGTGEAALVDAGTIQQRSSLGPQPVSYLSIELVAVDAPAPPAEATVLQPGQPFPAPSGLHDLDLLSAMLAAEETFTIPDSGAKNVVLITGGAASVARPGGDPVVLLAGEAASFSGELQISEAPDGGAEDRVSFVVAMIGPEVPPPVGIGEPAAPQATEPVAAPATPPATGEGSLTVQVFSCPPGMDAETVAAAACAPTLEPFDVNLSGERLDAPLTLADASAGAGSFTWSGLPAGDYLLAETVLPPGSTTYVVSAANTSGDPASGFRVTLDAANPEVVVRIYNFAPG